MRIKCAAMSEHELGSVYTDSLLPVEKGDSVLVDDWKAQIQEVCFPCTQLARDYSCEETGGLLILSHDGILVLLPFGTYHTITKIL